MHFFQLRKQNIICWKFKNNSFFQKHKHNILQNYVPLKSSSGFLFSYINKKHQDRFWRHSCKHQSIPKSQSKNQVPMSMYLTRQNQTATSTWIPTLCPELFQRGKQEAARSYPVQCFSWGLLIFWMSSPENVVHPAPQGLLLFNATFGAAQLCVQILWVCAAHWLGGILSIR